MQPLILVVDDEPAIRDLLERFLTDAGFAARSYPMVAVLVLRLPETAIALAAPNPGQGPPETLAHTIAAAAQEAATTLGIGYLKMLGSTIVAATGYDGDAGGTACLADLAVALRERCEALLEDVEDPAAFAIGLDVGLALGGTVGADPGIFNLWGEAVRGADALAASAPEGAIQASETAYGLLRQDFLFRPRGRFFRPDIGESPLYVLAGRV
jgi:adenylate cyclase